MKYIKLLALAMAFSSLTANAYDDANRTVGRLGVQANKFYFDVKEGVAPVCAWGVIYADNTTPFGKAALAQIIAAKHAGKMLSRVVYDVEAPGSTTCQLVLVEIN